MDGAGEDVHAQFFHLPAYQESFFEGFLLNQGTPLAPSLQFKVYGVSGQIVN